MSNLLQTAAHAVSTHRVQSCAALGTIGGVLTCLFGGWDTALQTLLIFMAIDYVTGFMVAAVGKSKKTKKGALSSKIGLIGLCKKGVELLMVIVAVYLDKLVGTDIVRNAAIIGFCANELLSIIENAGLLGVPLPAVITNAVEILKKKSEGES